MGKKDNGKKVQSVVLNYENGDRETVDNNFIVSANEELSIRMITKCTDLTIITSLLSHLSMAADHKLISVDVLEDFSKLLIESITKEVSKDEE